jgi:peptide/nickel transport system substrate-binding protein
MTNHHLAPRPLPLSRRRLVGASAAVAAGLAVGQSRRPAAAQAAGELIVGFPGVTFRTEPDRANIGMYPLNTNIFEGLVRLSPEYQVEPMLAESWEFVAPNTWRLVLRRGVTFHDGTPFTAEAVVWSLGRVARAGGGLIAVDEDSTVVVDDYTVEVTPIRPNRRFMEKLVHPNAGSIVAPGTDPESERVGTGPFREVEYLPEDRYVVEANPDYWGGAPKLSRITWRFLPDPTTRTLALQAGEVGMIAEVPREAVAAVEAGGFQILRSGVGAYTALYVNLHGEEPYDLGQDPVVREAVAAAIDKDAIVAGVWQGNAEPGAAMIPPAILGEAAAEVTAVPFDPDRARSLLDEAGWTAAGAGVREKGGRSLSLVLVNGFPSAAAHGAMPELIQAQLQAVGIAVEIVRAEDTAIYEARLQAGEGDLWVESGSQNDADPCFLPDLLFSSPSPDGDAEANMYGNAFAPGPAFDAVIETCRTAPTTAEVQTAAAEAVRLLIDQDHVVIPIAGLSQIYGAAASVTGFVPHPSRLNQRWTDVSVAE